LRAVNTPRESLSDYLEQMATSDAMAAQVEFGPEALVLEHGREFTGTPWISWRGTGWRRAKPKRCFINANRLALRHNELSYVEGFGWDPFGPLHHAWCVHQDGRVVDPTWHAASEETSYIGIVFPDRLAANLFLAGQDMPGIASPLEALAVSRGEVRDALLAELLAQ
jgi:hypothetical protein